MVLPDLLAPDEHIRLSTGEDSKEQAKNGLDARESHRYMQNIVRAIAERHSSLA